MSSTGLHKVIWGAVGRIDLDALTSFVKHGKTVTHMNLPFHLYRYIRSFCVNPQRYDSHAWSRERTNYCKLVNTTTTTNV